MAAPEPTKSAAGANVKAALEALEARQVWLGPRGLRLTAVVAAIVIFYVVCAILARVDLVKLATGLPKLGHWLSQAWPPRVDEIPLFLLRTAETVAMAAIGTTVAVLLALPMALLGSRNLTPFPRLYYPVRWFLNALRGIDSFVFALLFVAAVGLGPFTGVLGIALHTWGSAAKFFADHLENTQMGPYEAVRATGSGRLTAISYALVPDVLPVFASISLFWWEFNVRASTVLGVVGAGGIGQELKNSMDLLDFSRLFTIIALILVVITALDQLSNWLRRKLV